MGKKHGNVDRQPTRLPNKTNNNTDPRSTDKLIAPTKICSIKWKNGKTSDSNPFNNKANKKIPPKPPKRDRH
jgi:hypothetical protein